MPALPLVAGAYVAGTLLAASLGGPWWLTALAALPVAGVLRVHGAARTSQLALLAAVAMAAAGHARFAAAEAVPRSPLASLEGTHELVGIVRAETSVTGSLARTDVEVRGVDGAPASGRVRLTVRVGTGAAPLPAPGDVVAVRGSVRPRTDVRATSGVDATVAFPRWEVVGHEPQPWARRAPAAVRAWALRNIERSLPEPAASLAAGVLLGEERSMPASLTAALRATGTTHLVVVSGQNIAIVLGVAVALSSAVLPRRRAGLVALALLPGYVLLTGGEAPVVRAAVMAVGISVAAAAGRRTPAWVFLVYAAAAMLAFEPLLARDVSFQLSAAATTGVLLLAPPLTAALVAPLAKRGWGRGLTAAALEAAVVSLAAAVAVLPVQAAAFESASVVQVPANAAVAVVYQATVFVAVAAALLGWAAPAAAFLHASAAPVPGAFIGLVEAFASLPLATVPLRLPAAAGVGWYTATGGALWLLGRRARAAEDGQVLATRASVPVRRVVLLAVAGGLWLAVVAPGEPLPSVTVLDVGQGQAVLVRAGGAAVLVDAGPPDGAVLAALSRAGQRGPLDALLLTHDDADHIGGARELLQRVGARRVLAPPPVPEGALGTETTRLERLDIGDRVRLSERVTLEVLSPPARAVPASLAGDNNLGLVVMVRAGGRRVLLPGDVEAQAERWLVASGQLLRADALVVPHHGSAGSSTAEFVASVAPSVAVVSVGARNPYGHPASAALARYEGIAVYRTDEAGDVTLRTDGVRLWVQTARRPVAGASPAARATVRPRPGATAP